MRKRRMIGIVFIILLLVLFYKVKDRPVESTFLFPKEEIIHTNIEHIEILEILSNDSIVLDDTVFIENFSSFLVKLNSNNIDDAEINIEKPLYHIHIVNSGRNANTPIAVYKESIVYKGKKKDMTSEESSTIIQLLDGELLVKKHIKDNMLKYNAKLTEGN